MNWIKEHKLISMLLAVLLALGVVFAISVSKGDQNSGPVKAIRQGVTCVTNKLSSISDSIGDNIRGIFAYKSLEKENDKLKKENIELKLQLAENLISKEELSDLASLSEVLNYKSILGEFSTVTGSISSKDQSNWMYSFTIDRGTESGIKPGNTVVNERGLIGIVESTGNGWSRISSAVESTNKISFKVVENNEQIGIVTGGKNGRLDGYMLDSSAKVSVGNKIITSGVGKFPGGISIGTITKVEINEITLLKEIVVKTDVDFNTLDKVVVIL